jgi:hypothetical protein
VEEFIASGSDPEKLADILEVVYALAEQMGIVLGRHLFTAFYYPPWLEKSGTPHHGGKGHRMRGPSPLA